MFKTNKVIGSVLSGYFFTKVLSFPKNGSQEDYIFSNDDQ